MNHTWCWWEGQADGDTGIINHLFPAASTWKDEGMSRGQCGHERNYVLVWHWESDRSRPTSNGEKSTHDTPHCWEDSWSWHWIHQICSLIFVGWMTESHCIYEVSQMHCGFWFSITVWTTKIISIVCSALQESNDLDGLLPIVSCLFFLFDYTLMCHHGIGMW